MMVPQKPKAAGADATEPLTGRSVDSVFRRGRSLRLLARLRSVSLDDALLAGADPASSRQLAARAHVLTSPSFRAALAGGLERWLQAAEGRSSRRRVLPSRALAVENASEVHELVLLLRGGAPLYAGGIAMLARLLSDGTGPAYVGDSDVLAGRLGEARAAMAGRAPCGIPRPPRRARRSAGASR